jgi:hypothetical protein
MKLYYMKIGSIYEIWRLTFFSVGLWQMINFAMIIKTKCPKKKSGFTIHNFPQIEIFCDHGRIVSILNFRLNYYKSNKILLAACLLSKEVSITFLFFAQIKWFQFFILLFFFFASNSNFHSIIYFWLWLYISSFFSVYSMA